MAQVELQAAAPESLSSGAVIRAQGIGKDFPGIRAVDGVDFEVAPGEIVALLGQNGAGKSTLIKIISGIYPRGTYDGAMQVMGESFAPNGLAEAERAGIVLVPQEINVAPDLTVAENMYLNSEPGRLGFVDWPRRDAEARRILEAFELDIDPARPMHELSLAMQQLAVIARALSKKVRLLILDEPTAALTEAEAHLLFQRMKLLKARGVGIVFVSHRLAEVFEICDRIVVMRDGRIVGDQPIGASSRQDVVTQMIGSALAPRATSESRDTGEALLEVRNLGVTETATNHARVRDLSFEVRGGEILGLFGLLGSGCEEAAQAVFGASRNQVTGTVIAEGATLAGDPADAVQHHLGLVAKDRRDSIFYDHAVFANVMAARMGMVATPAFPDWTALQQQAGEINARLRVKAAGSDALAATLSGGNQQKLQVARWIATGARILVLIDPTRGVDVGARAEIAQIWRQLAASGAAILITSSDTDELVELCDRVIVLRAGSAVAELRRDELTSEKLLHLAADA